MSRLSSSQAETALERLAEQFTHWCQNRATARARIPSGLWAQAVLLSQILPISRVAKRLGLCLTDLKKRRGGQPLAAAAPGAPPLSLIRTGT